VAPKLLLDEHLSPSVAHRLTNLGFDVTCVRDRGLRGLDDWDLMEWCLKEGRTLCTRNARHFKREHERYLAAGRDHYGIITVWEWPAEQLFRALKAFLERTDGADMLNRFVAVEEPPPDSS
jgi:predicted nuclease of predicted toxin-antitoxin system